MTDTEKKPGRASSRARLLDAAADIVSKQGVQQLTIDAVAQAANVTKAGLIYHFKTRDDLLAALVNRMIGELDVLVRPPTAPGATPPDPKDALIQLERETFEMPEDRRRLMTNLLSAVLSHPHLIAPAQGLYARTYDWLAGSGEQAGQVMILALALDAIALLELLNLHRFTPQQRDALRAAMDSAIHTLR